MTTRNIQLMATEVAQHIAADVVIQGTYWDDNEHKGCFIGCLSHSNDPAIAADRFGLTLPLLRIAESIFEGLPAAEARDFFAEFPEAVGSDGKDLGLVHWQFLAHELRALPAVPANIQAVIDPVIAGLDRLSSGQDWPDAAEATDTAADAAAAEADAAWTAADAAARVAWAAAWAAWAAASAQAAARAADTTWAEAAEAEAAVAALTAADAAAADAAAAWAAADAADAAAQADSAAEPARTNARRRQRDTLLQLISQAPASEGGDD